MTRLASDPIEILIASDTWGTRLILDCCRKITRDQFHREFDIGLGSLHETLTHIVSVTRRWTDRLAGRTPRALLHKVKEYPHLGGEAADRSVDELLTLVNEAEADLVAIMKKIQAEGRLHSTVSLDWPGDDGVTKTYTFTRGAVLVHLTTHGYHHRAQCLNMLKRLGVPGVSDKLPDPSVVDWQAETQSPPIKK